MNYLLSRTLALLFLVFLLSATVSAQNPLVPGQETAAVDTTQPPIEPYMVSVISAESNNTIVLVNTTGSLQISEEDIEIYKKEVDSIFVVIDTFLIDTSFQSFTGFTDRDLDNAGSRANLYINQITVGQSKITRRYNTLDDFVIQLTDINKRWKLTRDQAAANEVPEALVSRINTTIFKVDSARALITSDMEKLLIQQDRLLIRHNKLETLKTNIQKARKALSGNMLRKDAPSFFMELSTLKDSTLFTGHMEAVQKSINTDHMVFKSEFSGYNRFIIIFFFLLLAYLFWFKYNYDRVIEEVELETTDLLRSIINSPLLITLYITGMIIGLTPDLPYAVTAINLAVLIIPLITLARWFFGKKITTQVYWLLGLFILTVIYQLLYIPDILQRMLLLVISSGSLAMYLWIIIKRPLEGIVRKKGILRLVINFAYASAFFTLGAIVANLIGAFNLATFLTLVPIQIAFLTLAIRVVIRFADLFLYVLLASKILQRVHAIADFFALIHKRLTRGVSLFFWLFFIVRVLEVLRLKELVFDWGEKVLTTKKTIGAIEISLESILIFIFVIWLSMFITKIVRYILERDVFNRVSVSKGVPGTIVMLVRISLITGGFMLAAAAAGMELTNLSIILGAFSVGIGFGLQNIFNNMVSGLILAFERPINVGDVVQVGELMGTVKTLGLRASKVKSFDGAEVIVPNGSLISNNLINWTLSDANRRMDIRVGVAYGTDPKVVLEIIKSVAMEHKVVRQDPQPSPYFLGFGDSSLDFRLLAWVDIDNRLSVESEIYTAINDKLAEAGIEIPFPQRDLHIRSDDTKVILDKGKAKKTSPEKGKDNGAASPGVQDDE